MEDIRFCPKCGTKLIEDRCSNCGYSSDVFRAEDIVMEEPPCDPTPVSEGDIYNMRCEDYKTCKNYPKMCRFCTIRPMWNFYLVKKN